MICEMLFVRSSNVSWPCPLAQEEDFAVSPSTFYITKYSHSPILHVVLFTEMRRALRLPLVGYSFVLEFSSLQNIPMERSVQVKYLMKYLFLSSHLFHGFQLLQAPRRASWAPVPQDAPPTVSRPCPVPLISHPGKA